MISLFNNNHYMLATGLLAMTILTSASVFFFPEKFSVEMHQAPLYLLIVNVLKRLPGTGYYFFYALYVAMIFLQSLLINRFVNNIKLFPKITHVPGLIYIVCASLFSEYLYFNAVSVANTLIVLIMIRLFSVYKKPECFRDLYDIGMLIGICSLIYFPSIALLLLFFIGLGMLRSFAWREWVVGVLGLLTPFILAGTAFLWNNQFARFLLITFESVYSEFKIEMEAGPELVWIGGQVMIMLMLSVFILQNNFLKLQVQFRKLLSLMLWSIVILLFSTLFLSSVTLRHFLVLCVPLSVILSYFFLSFKRWYIPEIFFGVWFISVVTFHYIK